MLEKMKLLVAARNSFNLTNHPNFVNNLIIPTILAIGFALRLIGINVGLPDAPDPREVIIAQDVLNLVHLTAVPQTYNWPGTAWFYLIALIGKLLSFGGIHLTETRVILLARWINVLLSTATLWLTYCIGLRCYDRRVGQIAAGLLTVAMLHATNESRFALVDMPATFCVTLFLYLVTRSRFSSDALTFRTAVWLGVIAGFSFAVKFTTVFCGFSLLCFVGSTGFYKRLATVIGVSVLTFTLLCPYWLMDLVSPTWNLFFSDFWYEAIHYHQGHFGLISTGDARWLQRFTYLWSLLKWGMGLPLALLVGLGVLRGILSLRREISGAPTVEFALLAFVIPYLLFIGVHKVKFARHLLILYPVLILLAAAALNPEPKTPHGVLGKWIGGIVGSIVVFYTSIYTAAFAFVLTTQPTPIAASEWITKHVPSEDIIVRAPEVLFDWLLPEVDLEVMNGEAEWILILVPDLEVFQKYQKRPKNYQEQDWYPLDGVAVEETLAFYERILGGGTPYVLSKTFKRTPHFLGIQISDRGAPFPMR
ncbi:MAG: glycosyltransferase family 39 protein, partial [Candidatus Poribacteria bacterium]|nr:glycosyltransferase family 39 protein [Candidatus Poribacteria bacterium]